jgi:hypothetical protein
MLSRLMNQARIENEKFSPPPPGQLFSKVMVFIDIMGIGVHLYKIPFRSVCPCTLN